MANISSIVVAVDFTPCSGNALREAMRLAARTGAAVRVVHVIDTLVVVDLKDASPQQRAIEEGLQRDAQAAWRQFAATVPGASELPFEARVNNRVVGILAAAEQHRADLLVLGAFGHRRPDVGIGTIASACVRRSRVDVLLVRDTQPGAPGPIVCAVDFSEVSDLATQRAVALASAADGDALHLLHVFDPPWNRASLVIEPDIFVPGEAELRKIVGQKLDAVAARVRQANPGLAVTTCVYEKAGHRSGINEYAASVNAGLVVLGTRGRSNLRDMLLGSTAEKTLLTSRCSVLAVRPRDGA